jgi:uncharacterized membrane protein (DUF373 family)
MLKFLDHFQKIITYVLIILMVLVVSFATVDLAWLIVESSISPPVFLLTVDEMLNLFGMFLLVLVGIELLDTIKAYLIEKVVHEQVIVAAALVAVLRKVIVLEPSTTDSATFAGIGVLILAVVAAYWVVKRASKSAANEKV